MEEINKYLYEGKFIYNMFVGIRVRMFCSNFLGYVVVENYLGIMLVNGYVYKDLKFGS